MEDSVKKEEDQFKSTMREYEATADAKYKTGVNVGDRHNFKQLWTVIDEAVNKYETKDTARFWGKIRLAFRKLGDGSETAQGWLGLLPTESNYLSVVCGGLKLIIKVV